MSIAKSKTLSKELNSAIALIGDSHVLCIISNLGKQGMRFNELQRAINGLNPTTLTNRLKKLEKAKIILRCEETVDRVSVVYELTDKGRALIPVMNELGKFAGKFLRN